MCGGCELPGREPSESLPGMATYLVAHISGYWRLMQRNEDGLEVVGRDVLKGPTRRRKAPSAMMLIRVSRAWSQRGSTGPQKWSGAGLGMKWGTRIGGQEESEYFLPKSQDRGGETGSNKRTC